MRGAAGESDRTDQGQFVGPAGPRQGLFSHGVDVRTSTTLQVKRLTRWLE
jgi:hypothetical protein